ncbi:uncharacterized protein LOC117329595 [Pecten maximus]|uniref:uncharacterized protein LOC117329595 n=1 Tax=Pecten maximus TaxID=6579 RepID=UPI001458574B|nr:uncharacterized protein LOC117329595 [Pecten maximus]
MACCWLGPFVITVLGGLVCSCDGMDVIISGSHVTWEHAKTMSGCKLAGLDRNGVLNINDITVLNQTGPAGAWIGAHVNPSQWIKITGCFKKKRNVFSKHFRLNISNELNPVETCFGKCLSDVFALTKSGCYCLNNTTDDTSVPCPGHLCGKQNNSLCGSDTCLCRYKQVSPDPVIDNDGDCMTVRKNKSSYDFISQDCLSNHTFLCSDRNQKEIIIYYGNNNNATWNHALFVCDHNGQVLLGLNDHSDQIHTRAIQLQNNTSYWIGMFRLKRFYWGYSNLDQHQCVALHYNPDQAGWRLMLRNCSSNLPVLCDNNNENTPTSSAVSAIHTTSHSGNITDTDSSSDVPLPPIIGATSGVIIIVLITSVACLIRRRRNENPKHSDRPNDAKESRHYVEVDAHHTNTLSSDVYYNSACQIQPKFDHTYNHLHSVRRDDDKVDDLYDHTGNLRSEYDSLGRITFKGEQVECDYDHMKAISIFPGSVDTGNYDTVIQLDKPKGFVPVDDTYDHV